jgi:hypothetical protein
MEANFYLERTLPIRYDQMDIAGKKSTGTVLSIGPFVHNTKGTEGEVGL